MDVFIATFCYSRVLFLIVLILCAQCTLIAGIVEAQTCGKRQINNIFLIVGGKRSKEGSWPWHAAIYHESTYACGASIINKNTILTAAHCLFPNGTRSRADQVSVHVGKDNLQKSSSNLQVLKASNIIIHPGFNMEKVDNDIGIVKLSSNIAVTDHVQPVCLWNLSDDQNLIVGQNGTVVGFGYDERNQLSETLQEATLTVADVYACIDTYGTSITRNMYCAGGRGASPCHGDSGGGMYFELFGTWFLRGLVSFISGTSSGLCDTSKYAVFTDVSKYMEWISSHLGSVSTPTTIKPELVETERKQTINLPAKTNRDNGFLMITHAGGISRLLPEGKSIRVINAIDPKSLDYDCIDGRIYYSDNHTKQILSAKYDGTDQRPFITEDLTEPWGIAIDWIGRQLYWSDRYNGTIEVANLDNPTQRKVVITDNVFLLFIALDLQRSKLFFIHWYSILGAKIEWANLDGSDRKLLIDIPEVNFPNGLLVNDTTGELCYTDYGAGTLACIDPYRKQTRTILSDLTNPRGLTIMNDRFYWINEKLNRIESSNLNGSDREFISMSDKVGHIKAVSNTCSNI